MAGNSLLDSFTAAKSWETAENQCVLTQSDISRTFVYNGQLCTSKPTFRACVHEQLLLS